MRTHSSGIPPGRDGTGRAAEASGSSDYSDLDAAAARLSTKDRKKTKQKTKQNKEKKPSCHHFHDSWFGEETMEILTTCLSADCVSLPRELPRLHCHANERDPFLFFFFFFCLLHDYFPTARVVSAVNSSKVTHSLWLISLCLRRIRLPVFEALQWADDCLGRGLLH